MIESVGIIGAGTMGNGIAQICAAAGLGVGAGAWGCLRGAGGTGNPSPTPHPIPERSPDATVDIRTATQAALLYRLSGDYNPVHADPKAAAKGASGGNARKGKAAARRMRSAGEIVYLVLKDLTGGDITDEVARLQKQYATADVATALSRSPKPSSIPALAMMLPNRHSTSGRKN